MSSDIRNVEVGAGRSINLALSRRGIDSLKGVGLDKEVVLEFWRDYDELWFFFQITSLGLPMHSRMIHLANGTCYPVPYGNNKEVFIILRLFWSNLAKFFLQKLFNEIKIRSSCDQDETFLKLSKFILYNFLQI